MAGAEQALQVELAWSPAPGAVEVRALSLPAGATVADALAQLPAGVPQQAIGIWGHKAERGDRLSNGDRVEVYRALTVDPMEARRRRHQVQGGGRRIVSRHRPAPR